MEKKGIKAALQNAKVLIISDEPVAARVWEFALHQMGLEVTLATITSPVIEIWAKETPDLILFEDFDEQLDEITVCRELREMTVVPILLMTNKNSEAVFIQLYQAGVDECIPFPITPRLLQAKIKAWLRRSGTIPMTALDIVQVGDFQLDAGHKCLTLPTHENIRLTLLESRVLFLLMSHPGENISSEDVIEKVWGHYGSGDSRLLKDLIYRLRKKIEPDPNQPRHLLNERSAGYRFENGV